MVVTFGEILLRLSPPGYSRLAQAKSLDINFGGSEANVAVSLANFGHDSRFITKLPENDIGKACIGELRRYGVDTSMIKFGGERVGIYFYEKGFSHRASNVIYDRENSAMALAQPEDFDWNRIFENAEWFHFSGITPAISNSAAALVLQACKTAKEHGIVVSCDLNYRKKLWNPDEARKIITGLMEYVDILISNEEHASDIFEIKTDNENEKCKYIVQNLIKRFGFKKIALTIRKSISANVNEFSALLSGNEKIIFSKKYDVSIIDRVGSGDSFCAGLIYGLINNYGDSKALEFAVAASCFKHTIEGDFNIASVNEISSLAGGDISGRVRR